jgi:hypothetical protein
MKNREFHQKVGEIIKRDTRAGSNAGIAVGI